MSDDAESAAAAAARGGQPKELPKLEFAEGLDPHVRAGFDVLAAHMKDLGTRMDALVDQVGLLAAQRQPAAPPLPIGQPPPAVQQHLALRGELGDDADYLPHQ